VAVTADGVRLAIDRVDPTGPRRAVALCLHAMMTDGRAFAAGRSGGFAATLAAAGVATYVLDWRGHGRSVPPRAGQDDWSFDDLVELDLPAVLGAVAVDAGVGPERLAIVGHSLGGLVALAGHGTGVARAGRLVLLSTSVWLPGRGGSRRRRALMAALAAVTRTVGRAPIRALRIGPSDEAASYVAQLTGWARTGRWTSRRGVDYLDAVCAISTPTCGWVGDRDWMCRPRDADVLLGRVPGAGPARVIAGADHFSMLTDRAHARAGGWWGELAATLVAP
jgi:pimeloyl-ACP methyl ester carboxylesterase